MKAVTWQGANDVRVEHVPDAKLEATTDVVIRVTSSGLCGSDLHLYETMAPFMEPGDILGHEPMGVVEEVGADVTNLAIGDRIAVPFNISCGHCWMCTHRLQSQCETTQNHEQGTGASLLGFSKLYGQVPGGQAEYLRVPHAGYGAVKVPHGPPDDRFVYLSDVLPTAWQSVEYADVPDGGTLLVLGAGPIGDMAARIALHRGIRTIVADLVPERLQRVRDRGAEVVNIDELDDTTLADVVRDLTDGRGADSVVDAVGMEAHGSGGVKVVQKLVGLLPDAVAEPLMQKAGVDRLAALYSGFEAVRRGGTVSVVGVYGGGADPMPMFQMFDKQIQLRMGQANVRAWTDDILKLLQQPEDVLGVESFATHHLSLDEAPTAYDKFQKKEDGVVKVVFRP